MHTLISKENMARSRFDWNGVGPLADELSKLSHWADGDDLCLLTAFPLFIKVYLSSDASGRWRFDEVKRMTLKVPARAPKGQCRARAHLLSRRRCILSSWSSLPGKMSKRFDRTMHAATQLCQKTRRIMCEVAGSSSTLNIRSCSYMYVSICTCRLRILRRSLKCLRQIWQHCGHLVM